MDDLTRLANYHHSDKGTTADSKHGFTKFYERYFKQWRNEPIKILEVGVYYGASLRMYYDYFPKAEIHGIDIVEKTQYNNDRITTHVVDQSSMSELNKFVEENSHIGFDIIIDDGSHHMADQQITFYALGKLLKCGGFYIIEDLHTSLGHNGTMLYGKRLEIFSSGKNTTLNFLYEKPFDSVYLRQHQNAEIEADFGTFIIHTEVNGNVPAAYGGASITSIVEKRSIIA